MSLTQINKAGLDEIALDHVFTIGASGSSAYTFQGEGLNGTVNNPTLYLTRGKTYRFENGSGGHPIRIQSTSGASGTAYNTGVTNNAGSGTVIVEVQHDAPDVLYYQCTSHAAMNGILYITGALADGGVTTAKIADDAVTNAKIAASAVGNTELANNAVGQAKIIDNAVTTAKIANNAVTVVELAPNAVNTNKIIDGNVTSAKLASDSVTSAKIVDQAVTLNKLPHGTSSNDGKFLRANNGADPSFETVTSTTINNNADNRIITGSGTANTLNGESDLTYDNSNSILLSGVGYGIQNIGGHIAGQGGGQDHFSIKDSSGTERVVVKTHGTYNGNVGIGTTSPSSALDVNGVVEVNNPSISTDAKLIVKGNDTNNHDIITAYSNVATRGSFAIRTGLGTSPSFLIGTRGSSETLAFMTDSTERLRVTDNGLTFNGDTAAANALDDYEEGTWTPVLTASAGSSATTSVYHASYTKVGNQVFITAYIGAGSISNNAGLWTITGLPFTSKGSNHYFSISVGYWNSLQNNINHLTGTVQPSDTAILMRGTTSATSSTTNLSYSQFVASGTEFLFSATYLTA